MPDTQTSLENPVRGAGFRPLKQLLLTVFSLIGISNEGRIFPDKTFPVTLSSTNAGDLAQYNFTLQIESTVIPDCSVDIEFPEQQYVEGLGLDYNFKTYSPVGNSVKAEIKGKTLKIYPGYREKMESFTLIIDGIQNPYKVGGSGFFKVYYSCSGNKIDYCEDFATIAVTNPKRELNSAKAMIEPGFSDRAGLRSQYLIKLIPQEDLNKNSVFRVVFPSYYNFTYLKNQLLDFPSDKICDSVADNSTGYRISGNITCKFSKSQDNVITWVGNDAVIPKASPIWLRLKEVYNPPREMITEFLKVQIKLKDTNLTYEHADAVDGLIVKPGYIENLIVKPVLQLPVEPLSNYEFLITFTPTNAFNSFRIVTRFREIFWCYLKNAVFPDNPEMAVKCQINSNVLSISNMLEYKRKYKSNADRVEVKVRATAPLAAGTQIPFEVYTYFDNQFSVKADENINSKASVLYLQSARKISLT